MHDSLIFGHLAAGLDGLCGTTAIEINIFGESRNFRKCNCTSACLTSIGDDN